MKQHNNKEHIYQEDSVEIKNIETQIKIKIQPIKYCGIQQKQGLGGNLQHSMYILEKNKDKNS